MPLVRLNTGIARQGAIYEPGDLVELGETEAARVIGAGQGEPVAEAPRAALRAAPSGTAMRKTRSRNDQATNGSAPGD